MYPSLLDSVAMYEHILGFTQTPFSFSPDTSLYVPVAEHEKAVRQLMAGLNTNQGISLLTGAVGSGKTLLAQKVVDQSQESTIPLFLPSSCFATRRAFFQSILFELRQPFAGKGAQELRLQLTSLARQMSPRHRPFLLVIDEAHLLTDRLLDEIRNSLNLVVEGESVFRILLVGNPELEERLAQPTLAHVNSRIGSHAMIGGLSRLESTEYLQNRLRLAGGNAEDLFEAAALNMMAEASDGSPRALNQLADHVLRLSVEENQLPASTEIVLEALEELQHLPTHWNLTSVMTEGLESSEPAHDDSASEESYSNFDWEEGSSDGAVLEVGSSWEDEELLVSEEETVEPELEADYLIDSALDAKLNAGCGCGSSCGVSGCCGAKAQSELEDPEYSALDVSEEPLLEEIQAEVTLLNDVLNVQLKQEEDTPKREEVQTACAEPLVKLDLSGLQAPVEQNGKTDVEPNGQMISENIFDRYAMIDAGKGDQLEQIAEVIPEKLETAETISGTVGKKDSDVFQIRRDELGSDQEDSVQNRIA